MTSISEVFAQGYLQSRRWFLIVLYLLFWLPANAREVVVAEWAISMQDQLSPVPKDIIDEVDDLWAIMKEGNHGSEDGRAFDEIYYDAARRMVELGDMGERALLWQYAKVPEPGLRVGLFAMRQKFILRALDSNPDVVRWLLPLTRARLHWLAKDIKAKKNMFGDEIELSAIKSYFYHQGEVKDVQAVEDLFSSAADKGIQGGSRPSQTIEEQISYIESAQASAKRAAHAHWEWLAISLVSQGKLDKSALVSSSGRLWWYTSRHPLPPNAPLKQIPQETTPPIISEASRSVPAWSVIAAGSIIAVIGLLWFLLKGRK